ncbi:MAG: serine hydrolase domain-containing protein [Candidatus Dormibacteria bacterium]
MSDATPGADIQARLDAQVDAQVARASVPGVAVGLLLDGVDYTCCRGVTSVSNPLPVDDHTLFQVGSTTKTLTATAALRLVDERRVNLDAPVRAVLPHLRLANEDVAARVTLRHLLTHTGGWESDVMADFGRGDDALARYVAAMVGLPQVAPLGFWGYQNSAFALAGRVIEIVTGQTYEDAVQDLVLRPIGMERSVFSAADAIVHRVAIGHHEVDGRSVAATPWEVDRPMNPAGGLVSTVRDQLRYARFHLGDGTAEDGTKVLSEASLTGMRERQGEAGGGYAAAIGLGWLLQSTPGLIAHGGSTNGQESAFALVPDRGFAFTVLTNGDSGAALQRALTKWAIRDLAGVIPVRPELVEAGPEARQRCVGVYVGGAWNVSVSESGQSLEISVVPTDATKARMPGSPSFEKMQAIAYRGGRFQMASGAMRGASGEFIGEDGAASHVRLNGRLHVRVPR